MPDILDNTPWWLPDVTTARPAGLLVPTCNPFGFESGGPKHLEGGFLTLASLGPHLWQCKARADGQYRMTCTGGIYEGRVCAAAHKGRRMWLCNGHVMMIRKRASGVCPPCAHPEEEKQIQAAMTRARMAAIDQAYKLPTYDMKRRMVESTESRLWDLQEELNELVRRGIVHRCPVELKEVA